MVLVAAGAVDHGALLAEAERRLMSLDATATPDPTGAVYGGGAKRSAKSFEQTHLVLAFEAPPYRLSQAQASAKLTERLITEDKVQFLFGPYSSGIANATAAINELATGYPGYNGSMPFENGFLSEMLQQQGYVFRSQTAENALEVFRVAMGE